MICLIALVVFGVMALFSAKYRPLAAEAFDCVLRRITFRPCVANLDQRIKGQTSAWLLEHAPWAARSFYKNFELLSWAFTLLMIWSLVAAGLGVYNWWAFGNCNGPGQSGFCVFNSIADGSFNLGALLGLKPPLIKPASDIGWLQGEANADLTIIEFGCYTCPYTKKAEPAVKELLEKYKGRVNVLFKAFPLPNHPYSTEMALASEAAARQGQEKWRKMHDALFERQDYTRMDGEKEIGRIAEGLGLDMEQFWADFRSAEALERVETTRREGEAANIYGTPTFFIGEKTLVGPQSFEELRKLADEALAKK